MFPVSKVFLSFGSLKRYLTSLKLFYFDKFILCSASNSNVDESEIQYFMDNKFYLKIFEILAINYTHYLLFHFKYLSNFTSKILFKINWKTI